MDPRILITVDKVKENRLRRILARRGYRLEKNRIRDRYADGYGLYEIWGEGNVAVSCSTRPGDRFTLNEVEAWIEQDNLERDRAAKANRKKKSRTR